MRSTLPADALARLLAVTCAGRASGSSIRLYTGPNRLAAVTIAGPAPHLIWVAAVTDSPWTARLQVADVPLVQAWLARLDPADTVRIGAAPSGTGTSITLRCGHAMLRVVNPGTALAA